MKKVPIILGSVFLFSYFSLYSRTAILEQSLAVSPSDGSNKPADSASGGSVTLTMGQTFAAITRKRDLDKAKNKFIGELNETFSAFLKKPAVKNYQKIAADLFSATANQKEAALLYATKKADYLKKPSADQSLVKLEVQVQTMPSMRPVFEAALTKANLKSSWDALQSANATLARMSAAQNRAYLDLSQGDRETQTNYDARLARIQSAYQARAASIALTEK